MKKNLGVASVATVAVLYGLLLLIVTAVALSSGVSMWGAIGIALVITALQILLSPFLTDLNMKWFYRASFDTPLPESAAAFVSSVCEKHGMKYPRIGYIDDGAPNAFTYGYTKNSARIVVTRGLFELLNEEEIEGVLAHEIGHAVHYDMLIMTAVQVVPSVMYAIYNTLKDVKVDSSKSKNNAAAVKAGLAFAALILYAVSQYIILWLSRTREYFADEFSVQATCNPNALSRALVQIGLGLNIHGSDQKNGKSMSAAKGGALGISDTKSTMGVTVSCMEGTTLNTEKLQSATRWELQNPWAKFYELGSTHPLTSKRIKAIGEMCPQYGQEPLLRSEAFDEKYQSMASAFVRDLFIAALPWLIVVVGGVIGTVAAGISGMLLAFAAACVVSLLKYRWIHPKKFEPKEISDLLDEVDVSRVKCVPCEIKGQIIGRGDPGCVFNEDFVMKDESGIMLLDYNQPLRILNKLFALFRASAVQGREVTALGWYRRAPIPFVELKSLSMSDGTKKKCWTVTVGYIIRWVGVALFLLSSVLLYVTY